jgi:hypothetical protein
MGKIITLALFEGGKKDNLMGVIEKLKAFDGKIEVIYHLQSGKAVENTGSAFTSLQLDDYAKFVKLAQSLAKGDYFLATSSKFTLNEEQFSNFIKALSTCKANVVAFDKAYLSTAYAFKTNEIKKIELRNAFDGETFILATALTTAKTCEKLNCAPFEFLRTTDSCANLNNFTRFDNSAKYFNSQFNEVKTKLSPTVYKLAFDALCAVIIKRYLYSLYFYIKKVGGEDLGQFDEKLKSANPFVYYGVERQFPVGNLKKMRANNFKKVDLITAFKIKSYFNGK